MLDDLNQMKIKGVLPKIKEYKKYSIVVFTEQNNKNHVCSLFFFNSIR